MSLQTALIDFTIPDTKELGECEEEIISLLNRQMEAVNLGHASPFGIPSKKKCPTEFLNFFWLKSGHVLGKHKSEVWGVRAF